MNDNNMGSFTKLPTSESRSYSLLYLNNNIIGKNIVKCDGKLIFGIKEQLPLFFSIILLGLFLILIWSFFILPFYIVHELIIFPIIQYFSFLITGYYFFKCFVTEPGIIPRNYQKFTKEYINDQERLKEAERSSDKNYIGKSQISVDMLNEEQCKCSYLLKYETPAINFEKNAKQQSKPNIYRERYCFTCNILRPPKVSHCHFCDNCVVDFDHHCVFLSNCIGARNHKYFYIFIIFAFLFCFNLIVTSFIHLITILLNSDNQIFSKIISNHLILSISLGFIVISILLLICVKNKIVLFFTSFIGVMGLFYLFHFSKPDNAAFYVNPLSLILLYVSMPAFLFVTSFLYRQTKLVCLGLTTKEYESILLFEKQMKDKTLDNSSKNSDNFNKGDFYVKKIKSINYLNKLHNLCRFFFNKIPESLVLNKSV